MKTVWKFNLPMERTLDAQSILVPEGARVIDWQIQGVNPVVWMLVDPDAPMRPMKVVANFTGEGIPIDYTFYLGTFQLMGSYLVIHVWGKP